MHCHYDGSSESNIESLQPMGNRETTLFKCDVQVQTRKTKDWRCSVPSSSSSAAHLRHQQLLTCNFSTSEAVVGSFHQGLATSPRLKQGMSQNESLWGKKSQVGYSCGIHARKNQGQQKHSHGRPEPVCGSSTILRRKQNWCKQKQMKGNHHPSNWFVGLGNSFQMFKV